MNTLDNLLNQINEYDLNLGKGELRRIVYLIKEETGAQKCRMFLEGFKTSGEGYNGEHPPRTDKEMWESIRDDYFKIDEQLFGE